MLDRVKMISYNVNGLGNENKRREIFAYFKSLKASVILLQETHATKEVEKVWNAEWGEKIYHSFGTSAARGTAILFNRKLNMTVQDQWCDRSGRWLILELKIGDIECLLVSVYGPNEDKAEFYVELFQNIEIKEELPVILGGDLNTVLDITKDYRGINTQCPNHIRKRETIINYMEAKGLEDVWRVHHPNDFMFTFRKDRPNPMASRLDYFLISDTLLPRIRGTEIKPRYKSDHSRLELIINCEEFPRGRGLWKFNSLYLKDKDFLNMMNEAIKKFFEDRKNQDPIQVWEAFKIEIKMVSSEYAKVKAQAKNRLIELLEHKLDKLDKKLQLEVNQEKRKKILKDINRTQEFIVDEHEEKTKKIMFRSKCKYYIEGEKNTKYFLNLEKVRSNSRVVTAIRNDENIVITDPKVILREEKEFFKRLYRKEQEGELDIHNASEIKLSEADKKDLEKELSILDLANAVKQMENLKTPGHDGIPADFYKVFWSEIKTHLHEALNLALNNGQLYHSALRGVITLIPKKERDLLQISNWRPITLLNVDYKILAKALASKMKKSLPFLIHEDQTGFMEGRNIAHNLRKVIDIIQIVDKRQIQALIVSVDAEKCFDRWAWSAIDKALQFFNFGPKFRNKIQTLFRGLCSCIINNGHVSEFFYLHKGIAQGSGISPYLHLIIMEILAIRLRNNPNIRGIEVGGKELKTALFADDLTMFLSFDLVTLQQVTQELDYFGLETNFKVNYDKTSIYRVGSLKNSQAMLYTGKPFKWTNSPPKILGIDIDSDLQKMAESNYQAILQKVRDITNIWDNRSMSLMGKKIIVNSLIASLYVYKLNVLPSISDKQILKLEELINNFIWNNKKAKIPIAKLQNSKEMGGIKLLDIKKRDIALKTQWIPTLKEFPIIKILADQFLPLVSEIFWRCNFSSNDAKTLPTSGFWRDVAIAWSEINFHTPSNKTQIRRQILWFNSHIKIDRKMICYRAMYQVGVATVDDILTEDKSRLLNFNQFIAKFGNCIDHVRYNGICHAIPRDWRTLLQSDFHDEKDVAYFDYITAKSSNRIYLNLIENKSLLMPLWEKWQNKLQLQTGYDDFLECFQNIYQFTSNPKLQSFQFRFLHRKIFLNKILFVWGISDTALCYYCSQDYETIEHLFYHCQITKRFWTLLQNWFECQTNTEVNLTQSEIFLNTFEDLTLNAIVLSAKQFIFSRRILQKYINFYIFKEQLFQQIKFEFIQEKNKDSKAACKRFNKKWSKIVS